MLRFQVYHLRSFDKCFHPCYPNLCQGTEQKFLLSYCKVSHAPSQTITILFFFFFLNKFSFACSRMSHKQNNHHELMQSPSTLLPLLVVCSFLYRVVFCCSDVIQFALSVLLWSVSSFCLWWIKLLWIFLHKSFCEHHVFISLGSNLGLRRLFLK